MIQVTHDGYRSLPSARRHKKSKKRRRGSSVSSDTDSEEERRQRERKERRRYRKKKERKELGSRSRSPGRNSDDNERDRHHKRHRRSHSRSASIDRYREKRSATRTKSPEQLPPRSEDEDEWVEKPTPPSLLSSKSVASMAPPHSSTAGFSQPVEPESGDEVGPQPLNIASSSKKVDERQYGGALLRGEGSAMAAFLKDGTDIRIPRRGEIGLTSDEIAQYEQVGYVMSGSRHRRMNAVRMRKENQVISAEEKRGILKLQHEERERREAILREEFQQLVQEKLKSQGTGK
jgi:hypothetical protein